MTYQIITLGRDAVDVSGETFGRLTAICPVERTKHYKIKYLCVCECGSDSVVDAASLRCGLTMSCGCIHKEVLIKRNKTHGLGRPPEYASWSNMIQRCENPNNKSYKNYGDRGIRVDEAWRDFAVFYSDMGSRPEGFYEIERINNDGNYCKTNCVWATRSEQMRNTRNNRYLEAAGRVKLLVEWSEEIGQSSATIHKRIARGWSVERALEFPSKDQL